MLVYVKFGYQCQYNLNYWCFGDYLGIGCGVYGKVIFLGGRILCIIKICYLCGYMQGCYLESQCDVSDDDKFFEFFMNCFWLLECVFCVEFVDYIGFMEVVICQLIDGVIVQGYLIECE